MLFAHYLHLLHNMYTTYFLSLSLDLFVRYRRHFHGPICFFLALAGRLTLLTLNIFEIFCDKSIVYSRLINFYFFFSEMKMRLRVEPLDFLIF